MAEQYSIETISELLLVPQQADFYQTQLRAVSSFALKGAGADIGAGSRADQRYLRIGGNAAQNVSTFIWDNPYEAAATNFAVLPPQEMSRKYFGIVTRAKNDEGQLWVEGVDLYAAESRYGKLLVSYDSDAESATQIPTAVGAFIDTMRSALTHPDETNELTVVTGLDTDAHTRLGNAVLSFWGTITTPAELGSELFRNRGAYDLAGLILKREIERALQGESEPNNDRLTPYKDMRGNVVGFVREESKKQMLTVMIRNNLHYPDRINLIQIPKSFLGDEDTMVNHYSISRNGVGTRVCILPTALVSAGDVNELIARIQRDNRPLEALEPESLDVVVRELHSELGRLISSEESQSSET